MNPPGGHATIRTLDVDGVQGLLDRAAAEGWNPGTGDAQAFHAADPGGFLERRVDGRFAAGISVVRLDARNAFLGLYIAEPALRGRGHGLALWRAGLERLAALGVTSVGLDGVVEQQSNYRASGFEYAHANFRCAGDVARLTGGSRDVSIEALEPADLPEALALDESVAGVAREAFLSRWWTAPADARRLTLVARRGGALVGVGTVRRCLGPHKIGPLLVAEPGDAGVEVAAALLRSLGEASGAAELTIDVPGPNRAARAWLGGRGFEVAFETARMYLGPAPRIDTSRLWGVGTLELG